MSSHVSNVVLEIVENSTEVKGELKAYAGFDIWALCDLFTLVTVFRYV